VQLLLPACQWLAESVIGTRIRESDNLFSAIETVHVLGITGTVGTIAIVDLRILGLVLGRHSLSQVIEPLVKITWIGFAVMGISGALLFWSEADKLYFNSAFRLKLVLLCLAGLNQWMFHAVAHGTRGTGDVDAASRRAKLSASVSLGLWIGVIVLGRAIAYL
jgi:hypothetical protein